MTVRRLEDLIAHQFIQRFKQETYALIKRTPALLTEFRYVSQIREAAGNAASDVSEGFKRGRPAEFASFLRYSLSSLAEAKTRLLDGIDRESFTAEQANEALLWADRSNDVISELRRNQVRMAKKWKEQDRKRQRRRRPDGK